MSGPDRPTLYNPEHADCARELRARSVITPDLAGQFGVGPSPIGQSRHCQFAETMQQGRDVAAATAIESLFTRIIGGNHQAEKVFRYRGERKTATDAKMSGGNAGNAGNLQSLGNSGLLGLPRNGGNRRKLAETPYRYFGRESVRPFAVSPKGCSPNSQYRHRLRKLRKLLCPAGNDTAAARLL